MGSTHLLFLLSSSPIYNSTINPRKTPNFSSRFRSSSSSTPNRSSKFDAFRSDPFEFDDNFRRKKRGNPRREKRKNWWDDDDDDDDDDDEDEDEDYNGGFGFLEQSKPIDWVFKALGIFGWMVPALVMSMLQGTTGTHSLIMAVVLPLGQTVLSLVLDRLWGNPSSRSKSSSRYKTKLRPLRRSRNRSSTGNPYVGIAYGDQKNPEARKAKGRTAPGRGGYQFWGTTNYISVKKDGESGSRFGGWDELDDQVGSTISSSKEGQSPE